MLQREGSPSALLAHAVSVEVGGDGGGGGGYLLG